MDDITPKLQRYVPSVRDIGGLKRTPVLAESNLSGTWIPPMEVYVAADVDKELDRLKSNERIHEAMIQVAHEENALLRKLLERIRKRATSTQDPQDASQWIVREIDNQLIPFVVLKTVR